MRDAHATISPDVLARYADDAARESGGVHGLRGRKGTKVDCGLEVMVDEVAR